MADLISFITESNEIEGIYSVTAEDIEAHETFMSLDQIKIEDIQRFVSVVAGANLREKQGMNVVVGKHKPKSGGPLVKMMLEGLCAEINGGLSPYEVHNRYETLHPFMDGNGRSGRVIWLWMMQKILGEKNMGNVYSLGFLHSWYYQSLTNWRF